MVSVNVYECKWQSMVTSRLESLGAISLKRYRGQREGQETGGCFAFLAGQLSKRAQGNQWQPCTKDQEDNEPNELSMNFQTSSWSCFRCLIGFCFMMSHRDQYAWLGRRYRMIWTDQRQGSERGDLLRQAMKDWEGEGVERTGVRGGKAAKDHRDLLGLWLRGKRKQRWLIKIMLALECVWHLDETVSLVSIQSNSCPDWFPSPKEKQLSPGYKGKNPDLIFGGSALKFF